MEPGTFKDRVLIEGNPHQLIEGMMIAALRDRADDAYIFLRWRVPPARRSGCEKAIDEAYAAGYLGPNIARLGLRRSSSTSTSAPAATSAARRRRCSTRSRASARRRAPSRRSRRSRAVGQADHRAERRDAVQRARTSSSTARRGSRRSPHREDGGTKLYGVQRQGEAPGVRRAADGHDDARDPREHAGGMRDGLRRCAA